jgi:hypothetical protein
MSHIDAGQQQGDHHTLQTHPTPSATKIPRQGKRVRTAAAAERENRGTLSHQYTPNNFI